MDRIEQATAAPGEVRNVRRVPEQLDISVDLGPTGVLPEDVDIDGAFDMMAEAMPARRVGPVSWEFDDPTLTMHAMCERLPK